jgi:2-pyrone-4,6-dicarboxylate lactonase
MNISQEPQKPRQLTTPILDEPIWDCHFHIFGSTKEYTRAPGRSYEPPQGDLNHHIAALRAAHKAIGVGHGVIAHPGGVYGTDNQVTLDALTLLGPGYRGIALIDTSVTDSELARLHAGGVRGFRLNLRSPKSIGLAGLGQLAPRLSALGWHVEILIDANDLPRVHTDIRNCDIPVVLDHLSFVDTSAGIGAPGFQSMLRLVGDGKVVVKLSAAFRISARPDYSDTQPFLAALAAASPDHLVWGTDWPHIRFDGVMPQNADLLESLVGAMQDKTVLRKILVHNPRRIYG